MGGVAIKSRPQGFVAGFGHILPVVALLATVPLYWWYWGFTVDDAWIVARIAERGVETGEFSFNPQQPTDAVTPLGFAQVAAVIAGVLSVDPFLAARGLGVAAMTACVVLASRSLAQRSRHGQRFWPTLVWLVSIASCAPAAAWMGAGLATPVATLFATLGFIGLVPTSSVTAPGARNSLRVLVSNLSLGAAAAWRPELLPFALATATLVPEAGCSARASMSPRRKLASILGLNLLVLALPLLVAMLRLQSFGDWMPLSARAKEPSFGHGLRYALGVAGFAGPFSLVWVRSGKLRDWRLATPFVVHLVAIVFAGGDWMPFFRLAVPVLPALIFAGALGAQHSKQTLLGLALVIAAGAVMTMHLGPAARATLERRSALVARTVPHLEPYDRLASVDIGWVGRATSAEVVDLGGVTNPRVAALPGGHTSRRISPAFLAAQEVGAWVVRAHGPGPAGGVVSSSDIDAVYVVDQRLLRRREELGFVPVATFRLPPHRSHYVLLAATQGP